MDRLPHSQIPYHAFQVAKQESFIECRRSMTQNLISQFPNVNAMLVEADVKAFLDAHIFDSTLMPHTRVRTPTAFPLATPSRRGGSGRNSPRSGVISSSRRRSKSVGSRSGLPFKMPMTPRPVLTRSNALASSSSSTSTGTTAGFPAPSTPTRHLLRTTRPDVTPLTRINRTPSRTISRTAENYVKPVTRTTLFGFGTLKDAYIQCHGNKHLMVRHLRQINPAIDIDEIKQDVDTIIRTLR